MCTICTYDINYVQTKRKWVYMNLMGMCLEKKGSNSTKISGEKTKFLRKHFESFSWVASIVNPYEPLIKLPLLQ